VFRVGDLAMEYGFTDVDGRRVPPFELPETASEPDREVDAAATR
jgi:hypothetical protein